MALGLWLVSGNPILVALLYATRAERQCRPCDIPRLGKNVCILLDVLAHFNCDHSNGAVVVRVVVLEYLAGWLAAFRSGGRLNATVRFDQSRDEITEF